MKKQPGWLKDHPKDLIFKFINKDLDIGQVWYRKIDTGFEIDYLEVTTSLRGQGYGLIMIYSFIEFCKTYGTNKTKDKTKDKTTNLEIWLEVSDKNLAAYKLYLKAGFKQLNTRPRYYKDGSDAIVMVLNI